jgi:ribosomal subunit interface protein
MSKLDGKGKRARAAAKKARRPIPTTTVTVTFRHVEPSDAVREYAERKLAHCSRLTRRPCEAHLILTLDKFRHCGEVTAKSGRLLVIAKEETKDFDSVIDLLAENVSRQLTRDLEKIKARKIRSPMGKLGSSALEES